MNNKLTQFASLLILCLASVTTVAHDEIPGAPQRAPIALVGATIHPVSSPPIIGTLIFAKGKITVVSKHIPVPRGTLSINCKGKHVYPGMFDAYSDMGLVEINAVRATNDMEEVGSINPNVRAVMSVNPDSEIIPVTRSNGILLSVTAPTGRLIAGQSAVLMLDGWTYEDMTLQEGVGMHIRWPQMSPVSRWSTSSSSSQQMRNRDQAIKNLHEIIRKVQHYRSARNADPQKHGKDIRWEAMLPVLDGKVPVIVSANEIKQIQSAVAFTQKYKLRLIIYGGYDAPACAALLKKHSIPIIVGGTYRLPRRRFDAFDSAYTLPARLHAKKIPFCISGAGRFGASNVRNLPYHAATAVAYGLSQQEALRSITLSPAEILGVAKRVGSLEVGKDATLIVTSGNPLETATQVELAFIQGRKVDLNNKHKRLFKKYEEKLRR